MEVRPYTVNIPKMVLDDLRERIARTRWPDEISGTGWEYGTDLKFMMDLIEYWQTRFDWRAQERTINSFTHFRATVDGTGIHFIHEKGKGPTPLPIIITHGWPGSFVEMLRLIPLLTDPASHGASPRDAFDVVVPSLPGFGFSDRPTQPGMNTFRIADLWATLMNGLGYPRYGVQGGDWGASVSTLLGLAHPANVIGLHLNFIPGSYVPYLGASARGLSNAERSFLKDMDEWAATEGLLAHPTYEAPDAGVWAERFTGRIGGLDHREVPSLERLCRRHRAALHQGRVAHQRVDLLVYPVDPFVVPALLRDAPAPAQLQRGRASDCSLRRRALPLGGAVSTPRVGRAWLRRDPLE